VRKARTDKDRHLELGRGIHFCISAARARMESRITICMLRERMPGLRLDPRFPIPHRPNVMHRGPHTLPATW